MRKHLVIAVIVIAVIMLSSCASQKVRIPSDETTENVSVQTTEEKQPTPERSNEMKIIINGETFTVSLENNETAKAFTEMLPVTLDMSELHGNEKYCYLDTSLPSNPQSVKTINKGDIMLYGDDCIVIFYKTFDTRYEYTMVGHIDNTDSLEQQLGNGRIEISFE